MSHNYLNTTFTKWYTDICGRIKTCTFRDAQRLDSEKRLPREERPDGSTRQVPHRGVQEGEGEGRDCRMAPQEPEGTVSSAAPSTLERCVCVQEAAKGGGALAAAAAKSCLGLLLGHREASLQLQRTARSQSTSHKDNTGVSAIGQTRVPNQSVEHNDISSLHPYTHDCLGHQNCPNRIAWPCTT